jgi:hypothetical protein
MNMKTKLKLLSALAFAVILVSCKKPDAGATGPAGAQGPGGPVLTGNLKGFIAHYDLSGAKITTNLAGDSVSIDNSGQVAVTDATGLYSFTGLTTGVYNLTVKRSGYGLNKVQSVQFTGGGDTYRNVNLSKIPGTNVTTLLAYDTIISAVNYIRLRGTLPSATYVQSLIVYVGNPGSNTVNSSSAGQVSYYVLSVAANIGTFNRNVPTNDFYDLGYVTGNTAYFAAYTIGGNTGASSYADLSNNKTIFTALGPAAVLANAPVQ